MDGTTANPGRWRGLLMNGGLLVAGAFSTLMLFSFGGQLIVAPALLPTQWLIARNTSGVTSIAFSVLGGLLAAEIAWIGVGLAVGNGVSPIVAGLLLVVGVGVGLLFFLASRPRVAG